MYIQVIHFLSVQSAVITWGQGVTLFAYQMHSNLLYKSNSYLQEPTKNV